MANYTATISLPDGMAEAFQRFIDTNPPTLVSADEVGGGSGSTEYKITMESEWMFKDLLNFHFVNFLRNIIRDCIVPDDLT